MLATIQTRHWFSLRLGTHSNRALQAAWRGHALRMRVPAMVQAEIERREALAAVQAAEAEAAVAAAEAEAARLAAEKAAAEADLASLKDSPKE